MSRVLRWVFLFFLFFNVAYFVWAFFIADGQGSESIGQVAAVKEVGELYLLSEVDLKDLELAGQQGSDAESPASESVMSDGEGSEVLKNDVVVEETEILPVGICPRLGPIASLDKLKALKVSLVKQGYLSTAEIREGNKQERFRVYLASYASKAEAAVELKRLRAKKIDSYILTGKELPNAISLGLFGTEQAAQGMVIKMKAKGYEAKQQSEVKSDKSYWLTMAKFSSSAEQEEKLISVLSAHDSVIRIDSPCKSIALEQ